MLTLYYSPKSCALASHVMLEESGAEYEARLVDLGGDRSEYLKINPRGTVPALLIDTALLTENVAILSYIARGHPDAGLLPQGATREAMCLSILSWCASSVHISFRMSLRPQRFTSDPQGWSAISDAGRKMFRENLQKIDEMLSAGKWLMGDQYTIADAYPLVFYTWALISDVPVQDLRAYRGYKDRMLERPAVRAVLERECSVLLHA
jgi:glutathione S-transferase